MLSVALLYYVALIYNSRSMLFLVCAVLILELFLQIYNLFLFWKLQVSVHTPMTIIDENHVIPVELTLSNRSFFPAGQVRVWMQAVYPMRKKKQSFHLCSVVSGRKRGQSKSSKLKACKNGDIDSVRIFLPPCHKNVKLTHISYTWR